MKQSPFECFATRTAHLLLKLIPRIYNDIKRGEYPTCNIPHTNALRQVQSVNHIKTLFKLTPNH